MTNDSRLEASTTTAIGPRHRNSPQPKVSRSQALQLQGEIDMALRTLGRRPAVIALCVFSATAVAFGQNAGIGDPTEDERPAGAFGRNCPEARDATFVVDPVATTAILLPVTNAENADVSIYEFPLGGDIVHAGPSQRRYFFVPDASFDGRATLRFRITPKDDCDGGAQLGSVTLVGGLPPAPPVPDGIPDFHHGHCGIGASHVVMLASAGAMLVFAMQRRRPGGSK
jgi:hypothetical protein